MNALESVTAPTLYQVNQAMGQNDFVSVESMCREIVAEDPTNAQGWFLLGYSLHMQGELDEAIFMHIRATSFPETAALAYYNLGCAQALKGNADQAFKALNKAFELGVSNAGQYQGDSDLTSLRDDPRWAKLMARLNGDDGGAQGVQDSARASATASVNVQESMVDVQVDAGDAVHMEALHFWVGEWDCYSVKTGKFEGSNTLAFRVGKNLIHERWESADDPYSGESWNFYDPRTDTWKQTWIGTAGDIAEFVMIRDTDLDGVLYHGRPYIPLESGTVKMHRMHLRPIDGDRVRQTGTESTDNGNSWVVKYDLIYVKKGEKYEVGDMGI